MSSIYQSCRSFWWCIHDYQALIAGALALMAALITAHFLRSQINAVLSEGKRERALRLKQHEIATLHERRATAMALANEIEVVVETANLKILVRAAERNAALYDSAAKGGEGGVDDLYHIFNWTHMTAYSSHIKNTPLLDVETAKETAAFYVVFGELNGMLQNANESAQQNISFEIKAVRARILAGNVKACVVRSEKAVPLLKKEADEAATEIARLKKELLALS